jgi:hypothetical protein
MESELSVDLAVTGDYYHGFLAKELNLIKISESYRMVSVFPTALQPWWGVE